MKIAKTLLELLYCQNMKYTVCTIWYFLKSSISNISSVTIWLMHGSARTTSDFSNYAKKKYLYNNYYLYNSKIIYLVNETTHSRTGRQHEKNVRKQQEVSLVFLLRKQNITIKISFWLYHFLFTEFKISKFKSFIILLLIWMISGSS